MGLRRVSRGDRERHLKSEQKTAKTEKGRKGKGEWKGPLCSEDCLWHGPSVFMPAHVLGVVQQRESRRKPSVGRLGI